MPAASRTSRAARSRGARGVAGLTALAAMAVVAGACSGDGGPPRPDALPEPTRQVPSTAAPVADPPAEALRLPAEPVAAQPVPGEGTDRPNILVITADDVSVDDLGYMPLTQRALGDRGATMVNALSPTPICVPARASILSGQLAHNHGALTIGGEEGGWKSFDDSQTLPIWLQAAGYDTLFAGKYLNGYGKESPDTYVPPGWTDWRATVDPTTYNFFGATFNENGTLVDTTGTYSTEAILQESLQQIEAPERADRPWFQWVNYVAPHVGFPRQDDDPLVTDPRSPRRLKSTVPAPEHENAFDDEPLPDKPSLFEDETSDKEVARKAWSRWSERDKVLLRETHQQRLESLQSVDEAVADTVQTLRSTGQLDDTLVMFTGDNGYAVGEHNMEGKLWYFEEMTKIPLVMRGPGVPRGVELATPVSTADLATTIAALAGATPTLPQDGVDVWPYLRTDANARVVPLQAWPTNGGIYLYRGVVVGPWTYVRFAKREELYNRDLDPFELSSVARDQRFKPVLKQMRRLNAQYNDCAGETCPKDFLSIPALDPDGALAPQG